MENTEGRLTAVALAARLNGREYMHEVSPVDQQEAKQAGLVIVHGYSDDCMEFCGAIYDEVSCYGGGKAYLTSDGLLKNDCDDALCPYFDERKATAPTIEAVWNDGEGPAWRFETKIPHSTFEVFEDGELFCRGIVFALADVGRASEAANREAFEVFIMATPFYARGGGFDTDRDYADGGYLDSCVHGAWLAWNARGAK